jgi:DNA-binding PadR family transcriptional regulator
LPLKPSAHLIIGMLRGGVQTGYAIKRMVDMSTRFFWSASLAQVYPELARLAEQGYVTGTDEPHGERPRRVYEPTEKGIEAFDRWLRSERAPNFEFRDEGMLRLFFADALDDAEALELVRRLRRHAEELDSGFREDILPFAQTAPEQGFRFPAIVARWGADYYRWRAGWLAELEAELADG